MKARVNPFRALTLGIVCLLMGCASFSALFQPASQKGLRKLSPEHYPVFSDDMAYDGMVHGVAQSIVYLKRVPAERTFAFGNDVFTASHMIGSLEIFASFIRTKPDPSEMTQFVKANYWVYRSVGGDTSGKVLFTGYYEPLLMGSSTKTTEYSHPIYARPEDLVSIDLAKFSPQFLGKKIIGRYTDHTVVPYYDRKAIDTRGALDGKSTALAWLKDPIDLFFLQIQGSGKVYLETGETLNIHYHTANGHPYRSIGKFLIETGKIPRAEMSMQAIRTYLENHPQEVDTILNYNPSYVFFKLEETGPIGYLGVPLTPGRSIAVDRRIFPLSALVFIESRQPLIDGSGEIHRWIDSTRFALSQDIGGAIRGPGRADLFFGNGPFAEIAAGHLKYPGQLYFLVLKPESSRK
jgi:membrane-bound lytic murein transglycosylase A